MARGENFCATDARALQRVDGETLLTLVTTDALKSLGITSVGHRTLLKKLILDLKKQDAEAT